MLNVYLRAQETLQTARRKLNGFFRGEAGGAGIIAAVILIAIVVALGIIFKDQVVKIFNDIFPTVDADEFAITAKP